MWKNKNIEEITNEEKDAIIKEIFDICIKEDVCASIGEKTMHYLEDNGFLFYEEKENKKNINN